MNLDTDKNSRIDVVIVDYGTGNHGSIQRSLDRMRVRSVVSSTPGDIDSAAKIILPGVGHFGKAMDRLRTSGMLESLNAAVLGRRVPVLGICLGMELMAGKSEEGDCEGLGWLDARAVRFRISDKTRFKVPHMGWNRVRTRSSSPIVSGLDGSGEFYFAHAYHLQLEDRSCVVGETEYEVSFPSVVQKENIFGVQFHPEKSQEAGDKLLKNFIDS